MFIYPLYLTLNRAYLCFIKTLLKEVKKELPAAQLKKDHSTIGHILTIWISNKDLHWIFLHVAQLPGTSYSTSNMLFIKIAKKAALSVGSRNDN